MLTSVQSFIITAFTQTLLYGVYIATLIQSFRWLIFTDEGWRVREKINPVLTFATVFIFLMSTINLATVLTAELKDSRTDVIWSQQARTAIVMMLSMSEVLGIISIDAVLIYRCWAVYAKSWRAVCVPVTCWFAALACSVVSTYYLTLNYKLQTFNLEYSEITARSLVGLYASNIAITTYSTTAIIYRILSTRKPNGSRPRQLDYVVRILAESGILYTAAIIFRLVGAAIIEHNDGTWVEGLIADVSDAIYFSTGCITFNVIIIRVYQNRVELRDSWEKSSDTSRALSLTVVQSSDLPVVAPHETQESSVQDETTINEIQGHHKSRSDMHGD